MARRRKKQLFDRLPAGSSLPHHVDLLGELVVKDSEGLPFVYWPDDYPCVEANAYVFTLWKGNKSRRNRGGTIAEYIKNISHLINFCYNNGLNFTDLIDNTFTLFIQTLQARDAAGKRFRTSNEVLKIGRRCLAFLSFIGNYHDMTNFFGEKDCNINATKKEVRVNISKKGKPVYRDVWTHDAFPDPDPERKRHPIGLNVVSTLKKQAAITPSISVNDNANRVKEIKRLRKRKLLLISCFENTGGRRYEVSHMKVKDIEKANSEKGISPHLPMMTIKGGNQREIPVPRGFIDECLWYIKRVRRGIIKRTIGEKNDHGYLFINHITGEKLAVDTLYNEVNELCHAAGISTSMGHPHLFRHGYITQTIKALIEHYDIANKDDFRKQLQSVEKLKQEVQQWTGHRSVESLEVYIDLAFNELTHMSSVFDAAILGSAVQVALDRVDTLKKDAASGVVTATELMHEFESLLIAFQDDVLRAKADNVEDPIESNNNSGETT